MSRAKSCKHLPQALLLFARLDPSTVPAGKGCKALHTQLCPLTHPAPAARCYLYSGTVLNISAPFSLMWPWSLSFTTIEPEGGNTTPLKILLKQHLCVLFCCWFFFFSHISQQRAFCVFCRLPCSQPHQHLKLLSETWIYCWQDNQFKW